MDNVLLGLIGLAVGIAGGFVWNWLKTRPDYYELLDMARTVVNAAEQIFKLGTNEEKLEYALDQLSAFCKLKGWPVDKELIRALIEAAVKFMKENQKPSPVRG